MFSRIRTFFSELHDAHVWSYEHEQSNKRSVESIILSLEKLEKKEKEDKELFGFTEWDLLDRPCDVCGRGKLISHREIFIERGWAGNPKKCIKFFFRVHCRLAKRKRHAREFWKFWKRWLYTPLTKEEERAYSLNRYQVSQKLFSEGNPKLREYSSYKEEAGYWKDMTVRQLIQRRIIRIKNFFDKFF